MISPTIEEYLKEHGISYEVLSHPSAVSAQALAQTLHISGHLLAKVVLVEADGEPWMLALPASENVSEPKLAQVLQAQKVRLMREEEFAPMFPGVEPGAEPPFGRLFGVPLLVDEQLSANDHLVVRGGSHQAALRLLWNDFVELERPGIAAFGEPFAQGAGHRREVEPSVAPSMR